jgi:hypothetical protein
LRLQHPAGPTPSTPPLRRRPWPPVGKTTEVVLGEEAPPATSAHLAPRGLRATRGIPVRQIWNMEYCPVLIISRPIMPDRSLPR